jgi:cell wall-associated NlpC family hydrolase
LLHPALLAGIVGLLLTGCISSQPASSGSQQGRTGSSTTSADRPASTAQAQNASTARREADLREASSRWEGVPHEWGGTTRRGVDCSALVQNLYADVYGVDLPRTTESQARVGTRIDRSALQPGDLVFFRPGYKKRHVGVYLSDGEFVHASSSTGVTVSHLDTRYWRKHWWQARRPLPTSSPSATAPDSTQSQQRAGW